MRVKIYKWLIVSFVGIVSVLSGGCASLVNRATQRFADNLAVAILNQDDPGTVRDGVPAYLLLIDSLIQGDPQNAGSLLAGAKLYGAYAGGFVGTDVERGKRLATRAYDYARRATCVRQKPLCAVLSAPFEAFATIVAKTTARDVDLLNGLGAAWATRIQQDSGDWNAIADLPKVQLLFDRLIALSPDYDQGSPYMVLGVLHSLRPASLGGKPELGQQNFEQAIARSQGRNLMAKALYAQYYARLVFDQTLHDRLLQEVLSAAPEAPGMTLMNSLAQQRARALLESGKEYF
ncbi:MAG: TRAP transporter TatT component family protein [Tahibacter sp.]